MEKQVVTALVVPLKSFTFRLANGATVKFRADNFVDAFEILTRRYDVNHPSQIRSGTFRTFDKKQS